MKDYTNEKGQTWTAAERRTSMAKAKKMRKELGLPMKPTECEWCGQKEGIFDWHNEDYSHPIANSLGLCFRCHMVHHSKHFAKKECEIYFMEIEEGKVYPPIHSRTFVPLALENNIIHPRDRSKYARQKQRPDFTN